MSFIIFCLGFFSLIAQSLLFRAFFQTYDGNELGIAAFFATWLIWIGVGALLARLLAGRISFFPKFGLLVLGYIPAFLVQQLILGYSRSLAGVSPLEMFPYLKMFAVSAFLNFPVSIMTGFLFTAACQMTGQLKKAGAQKNILGLAAKAGAVNIVYVLEILGSFAGGLLVTVLLAFSLNETLIFVLTSIVVSLSVFLFYKQETSQDIPRRNLKKAFSVITIVILFLVLIFRLDSTIDTARYLKIWQQLMPKKAYQGKFSTPNGMYLYGKYKDSLVIQSYGNIVESVPDLAAASDIMAVHLAQRPNLRNVLVIGSSEISLCAKFLELPQIDNITWLSPDPVYQQKALEHPFVQRIFPALSTTRFRAGTKDVRAFLQSTDKKYDLVLIDFAGPLTSATNRYLTYEFYNLVRSRLASRGVLSVSFTAGENYLGEALIDQGRSLINTMRAVFPHLALKPGETSWALGSDSRLESSPAALKRNLLRIKQVQNIFPPDRIYSLYRPDRVAFQMELYEAGAETVINSDAYPQAYLFSLLFESRKTSNLLVRISAFFKQYNFWLFLLAGSMLFLGRAYYRYSEGVFSLGRASGSSRYDYVFLVVSAGLAAMALQIILMFYFETLFGSVFLYVGLISSLFMMGLFLGGLMAVYYRSLMVVLAAHLVFVLTVWQARAYLDSQLIFVALFFISGVLSGFYVPLAEYALRARKIITVSIASNLEIADHAGGALGAFVIGLFFLPIFGISGSLLIMALIFLLNIAQHLLSYIFKEKIKSARYDRLDLFVRKGGIILAFICLFFLFFYAMNSFKAQQAKHQDLLKLCQSIYSENYFNKSNLKTLDLAAGQEVSYLEYQIDDKDDGYVYRTAPFGLDVHGYGGLMDLLVDVDREGSLKNVRVISSNETGFYLATVQEWLNNLKGKNIFGQKTDRPEDIRQVRTVTGATVTSGAVLDILYQTGNIFSGRALCKEVKKSALAQPRNLFFVVFLAVFTLGAVLIRLWKLFHLRRMFLVAVLVLGGFWLNAQYSLVHVFSLFKAQSYDALTICSLLMLAVLAIVLLFGNIYCGYLCPFGALQELVFWLKGWLLGKRADFLKLLPVKNLFRFARWVKYIALLVIMALFFAGYSSVMDADPLASVFSVPGGFVLLVLAAGLFINRFWCRILCPTGAFLGFVGRVGLFKLSKVNPASCDLGVKDRRDFDCISCDRCQTNDTAFQETEDRNRIIIFFVVVFVAVLAFSFRIYEKARKVPTAEIARPVSVKPAAPKILPSERPVSGRARDLDLRRIKNLIRANKLSGKEALFYRY
ncbi:4Fe-4S binding protein [Candidatus Margulisiibacteriota bacterium]